LKYKRWTCDQRQRTFNRLLFFYDPERKLLVVQQVCSETICLATNVQRFVFTTVSVVYGVHQLKAYL